MASRIASPVEIEIIKACIVIAQDKGTMTARGEHGEDCWGRDEYRNHGIRVERTLFFYAPIVGFFALSVEENGLLVFDVCGCIQGLSLEATQVFEHVPGPWEDKMFER